MILDLVSPWCAAVESSDPAAELAFRRRHSTVLEAVRHQRTPLAAAFPLETDLNALRRLARRAADSDGQQVVRDALARATRLGIDGCRRVVLLSGGLAGDPVEPLPDGDLAVFLACADDDVAMLASLARAAVVVTRRQLSAPAWKRRGSSAWDRWEAARELPLREWIYDAGLGAHLGQALLADQPPHRILGLTPTAFARLREREKVLHARLEGDLDRSGIGLVLRWLMPETPAGPRTVRGMVVPPLAGQYLAWRMVAPRVARVGLAEAIRMES